jgi:hypothetical protein
MEQQPDKNPEKKTDPLSGEHSDWHVPLPETLPQPTAWPAVLAFGSCLLAWGIVTSWVISLVGLIIFLAGAGGWIARMRDEQPK